MKKIISNKLNILLVAAIGLFGCQDLDVINTNEPDEARALATPSDIESLIRGSFLSWHEAIESGTPSMGLAVMSDAYTCSWGNYGMSYLSQEPRVEFDNTSSFGDSEITEIPWFGLYSAISAASDGIRSIENEVVTLGKDNERALAFGKFVQGLSHGWLALIFDQGFILDEDVDLIEDVLELVPYTEVMAAAIAQLEEAIVIANANEFTLPDDWINGKAFTNTELAQVAHSFIARYMTLLPRSRAERENVNWSKVLTHIDQGITEVWGVSGDGGGRGDPWWNAVQWYSAENATWQRADYTLIGPSDRGTGYSDWTGYKPADRKEFIMDSGDLRIWDQTMADDGDQNPGLYFRQIGPSTFPLTRGYYYASRYGQHVFDEYRFVTATESLAPLFYVREHDFMRAEALLHTGGSAAEISALLDKTHVTNGGYTTTAGASVGSIADGMDPKPGASLWSILKYEKQLELLGTFPGLEFCDRRGWGDLVSLNLLHFPVPALDLETLQLSLYSHGGGVGNSAKRLADNAETLIPPTF